MRGEEDRDAAPAQVVDQLVDVPGGDRIQAGGRLVEEQHLGVAEQRPGQGDPLAQALGQRAAGVAGPLGEVDRAAGRARCGRPASGDLVQVGEALEVLGHAQPEVQPRRLGHDRDPPPDLHPVLRRERMPATVAEPEVGAMSVPSVRTVVVFPAPFGPRKPNTSPWPTSNETSLERDAVAEALAQAIDGERRRARACPRCRRGGHLGSNPSAEAGAVDERAATRQLRSGPAIGPGAACGRRGRRYWTRLPGSTRVARQAEPPAGRRGAGDPSRRGESHPPGREAQALSALARQLTPQADERGSLDRASRAFAHHLLTTLSPVRPGLLDLQGARRPPDHPAGAAARPRFGDPPGRKAQAG